MANTDHPYTNTRAVLATQHRKSEAIAPVFKEFLGMDIEEVFVDTDSLGTFSGEIERVGSARDVVIAKARMGIKASGHPVALASEGSIGADPFLPFINSDIELIAFVDENLNFELVESFRSTEIIAATMKVTSVSNLDDFLRKADFPNHKLLIKAGTGKATFSVKGIDNQRLLEDSLSKALEIYPEVILESDLRAHCSPSRMANIGRAAEKIARRLSQQCPECQSPGWGVIGAIRGLPCSECGEISEEHVRAHLLGCVKCDFTEQGKDLAESISPANCNLCNP